MAGMVWVRRCSKTELGGSLTSPKSRCADPRKCTAVNTTAVRGHPDENTLVQASAVQCSAVQCSAVQCSAVQCGPV